MDSAQDELNQGQDDLAGQESGNEPQESQEVASDSGESKGEGNHDPLYVQKRLKQQKRAHDREIREMHARIADMQSRFPQQPIQDQSVNPYNQPGQPSGVDEQIHRAVSYALRAKDDEERRAKEAELSAHTNRKYQDFNKHLDNMNDKYDDFNDVVMNPDAKFTPAMHAYAARTMAKSGPGSAGEVLYQLGKNPEELTRISQLHPDDQAEELHKLSLALIKGGDSKATSAKPLLGQIKTNPIVNSAAINDKTPVSSIRQRMKAGSWK